MVKILTVRHGDDVNALRTYKFNGPLQAGQKKMFEAIVERLIAEKKAQAKNGFVFFYESTTRRIKETAETVVEMVEQAHSIQMIDDERLVSIKRGTLILPESYNDGDWFNPLDDAWTRVNEEMFLYKNIFCRFGDGMGGKYPELTPFFKEPGNSFGEQLIAKYSLICDLLNRKDDENLVVVFGQSDFPLLLRELMILSEEMDGVTAENLPYIYFDRYRSGREDQYDREGIGFGEVCEFDLSVLVETGMDNIIKEAEKILRLQFEK